MKRNLLTCIYNYNQLDNFLKVTTLCKHSKKNEKPKRGRSKKASQLVKEIDIATAKLVEVGKKIADDFPEIKEPMIEACCAAEKAGLFYTK